MLSGAYGFQPRVPLHEAAYAACRLPGLAWVTRTVLRLHPLMIRLVLPVSVHQSRRINRELVQDAYTGIQEPEALEAFVEWMQHDLLPRRVLSDFTPHLHRLAMPVLILHGAYDWTMPVRYARRAHQADSPFAAPRVPELRSPRPPRGAVSGPPRSPRLSHRNPACRAA